MCKISPAAIRLSPVLAAMVARQMRMDRPEVHRAAVAAELAKERRGLEVMGLTVD
jgi:hypothetical protein